MNTPYQRRERCKPGLLNFNKLLNEKKSTITGIMSIIIHYTIPVGNELNIHYGTAISSCILNPECTEQDDFRALI